ncbi:ABC transporter ATP-binding protein [Planotetraspora thailandica]|uniref:ABC transporter ATP-binding protein n=1 Tax=Planotetraspora thailandica TaxID=487172 RepID=A0A8J3Y1X5_9ACTN|nr:ATP-binding cassette domain-containing protein [Planotetraspora thailandica]GII59363.1 ABC transporter ATP-binding protein [Planotetraspora thailandica]
MRVTNLSFRYGRREPWILTEAGLTLSPGDVTEIVGPNGTGKSTLLRLLAGLLRPSTGMIAERPDVIGYAPERFPAAQPFTVTAYLRHMAAVQGTDPRRIGEWCERLGMAHLLRHPLPDLSKGSAHKVGLVQALMREPGLLILDEPFAGLDAATRAELPRIIGEISTRGGIVVVSDHQGDLRSFPGLRRHEVRNRAISELSTGEAHSPHTATDPVTAAGPVGAASSDTTASPVTAGSPEGVVVLEVAVPVSKVEDLAGRLRAEGHAVRIAQEPAK